MALGPRLDLRQTQSLVMTPQLQQAIKLLALSNLELEGVLAEELAKNPLLDSGDSGEAIAIPSSDRAEATDRLFENGMGAAPGELDVDFTAETFHHDSPADSAWEPMAATDNSGSEDGPGFAGIGDGGSGEAGEAVNFDSFRGAETTLREHLLAQAGESLSGIDHAIAVALIESIEDSGYLDADLNDLAMRLGVGRGQIEVVLAKVQHFDPVGVGARSLSECIAIQAREADRYDPAMARMIDNLDMLAKGQSSQLRKMCGVDEEDWADMIRELRGYDPKPGLRFAASDATPVTPDLFVRQTSEGWAIEINNATLPRVLVNRQYYAELALGAGKGAGAKDGKAWLADCLASANWLVKALDQRQQTIIKVAREIVKQQEGFFLHGVSALKPLTLRQVAEAIAMHESTVSRVTSNKYLSCSRGMYELKYFFSSGIASADGEGGMSAEAIKSRIKALIDGESAKAILSDDTLVDLLAKEGCDIARRTVAKYREAMGIGSSVQRRRAKALAG
jgi:RNA polymerase sigma-54 factor